MKNNFRRIFINFLKDQDGGVAIEFGAVMMPFTMVVIGTVEVMLAFFSATMIENAISEASRIIRTGQIMDESDPETAFRDLVCNKALVIDCEKLVMNVQAFGGFEQAATIAPANQLVAQETGFESGVANDVVVAQISYDYEFVTPMLGHLLPGSYGNDMRIAAAAVIKNEPFQNR